MVFIIGIVLVVVIFQNFVDHAAQDQACKNSASVYFAVITVITMVAGITICPVRPRRMMNAQTMPLRAAVVAVRVMTWSFEAAMVGDPSLSDLNRVPGVTGNMVATIIWCTVFRIGHGFGADSGGQKNAGSHGD